MGSTGVCSKIVGLVSNFICFVQFQFEFQMLAWIVCLEFLFHKTIKQVEWRCVGFFETFWKTLSVIAGKIVFFAKTLLPTINKEVLIKNYLFLCAFKLPCSLFALPLCLQPFSKTNQSKWRFWFPGVEQIRLPAISGYVQIFLHIKIWPAKKSSLYFLANFWTFLNFSQKQTAQTRSCGFNVAKCSWISGPSTIFLNKKLSSSEKSLFKNIFSGFSLFKSRKGLRKLLYIRD